MRPEDVALLIMAGGRSRRFGADDKLSADLDGQPLGLHVAIRLAAMGWAQKVAVARASLASAYAALDYDVIEPRPDNGLGDNLALAARGLDAGAVLILLADMPFVTVVHVTALLEAATTTASIVCTRTGDVRSPPVLIGRDHFPALRALTGDQGARAIFAAAGNRVEILAAVEVTADIDTPGDLVHWRTAHQG